MDNSIKKNTNFWQEISEYNIQVPYYQRDYAQGRIDNGRIDNIRKVFVEELFNAIMGNGECHLGLVFGSYNDNDKSFVAVDGQQRLTTVFLLHWYVAWRENKLEKYQERLKNFTWNTRSFSSQFVDLLFKIDKIDDASVISSITTHYDFFSIWEKDPTVKGMLTMLKEIESRYSNLEKKSSEGLQLSETLFSDDCKIKYDILKLEKDSDGKTYLKMNSRGRSLTTFELFKSKFIGIYKPSFKSKFDDEWLNFMLKMLKGKEEDVDISYMNFINEYTFMMLKLKEDKDSEGYKEFIDAKRKGNLIDIPFISFEKYQEYFNTDGGKEDFSNFFDWIIDNYDDIKKVDDEFTFSDNDFFLEKIIRDEKTNFSHRTKFFSLFKYSKLTGFDCLNEPLYRKWNRVFRNLVENSNINNSNFGKICRTIDEIDENDIYLYLNANKEIQYFDNAQVKEEVEKVKMILDDKTWEDYIVDSEKCAFFKGSIRFLFTDEKGEINRDRDVFAKKREKSQQYFDENGVRKEYQEDAMFLRYYISKLDVWDQFWDFNYDFEPDTWKKLLLSNRYFANDYILTHEIENDTYTSKLLESNDSVKQTRAINCLINTPVLVEASKFNSKLNSRYDVYSLYPYNAKASWKIYVISGVRNKLLSELCDEKKVFVKDGRFKSGDSNAFFWGWDVNFTYKGISFQWSCNDNVYLLDDNNPDDKKFCFNASETKEVNDIIEKLSQSINT